MILFIFEIFPNKIITTFNVLRCLLSGNKQRNKQKGSILIFTTKVTSRRKKCESESVFPAPDADCGGEERQRREDPRRWARSKESAPGAPREQQGPVF